MEQNFSEKINEYGVQIDSHAMRHDYEGLKTIIDEMVSFSEANESVKEDAGFNYYLGTGLGTYSDYLVRSGRKEFDEEVIKLRSTSMYYFRKAQELYDQLSGYHDDGVIHHADKGGQ